MPKSATTKTPKQAKKNSTPNTVVDNAVWPNNEVGMQEALIQLCVNQSLWIKESVAQVFGQLCKHLAQQPSGITVLQLQGNTDFELLASPLDDYHAVIKLPSTEGGPTLGDANAIGLLAHVEPTLSVLFYWFPSSIDPYRLWECGVITSPTAVLNVLNRLGVETKQFPKPQKPDAASSALLGLVLQLFDQLDQRERALKLTQEQMTDLGNRLNDQERLAAVGQLCSVVAHEIRNPLGLIDLYAKLIEHQLTTVEVVGDKGPLEQNLSLIRTASQDLEQILSELTAYSRPLTLDLTQTNLCEVVQEVWAMYEPKAKEMGITLSLQIPEKEILVPLDRVRYRQALINLVKNALEASGTGKRVDIVLAPRHKDTKLYTKVYDQGSGVDEKLRAKLFTPYFSTKGNGTGLGLAHSRKILQAHGGSVELLKTDSTGSAFALVLPQP